MALFLYAPLDKLHSKLQTRVLGKYMHLYASIHCFPVAALAGYEVKSINQPGSHPMHTQKLLIN